MHTTQRTEALSPAPRPISDSVDGLNRAARSVLVCATVLCASAAGCAAEEPPIARSPLPHPFGPVVHVVTDPTDDASEPVSVYGLERTTALREHVVTTMASSGIGKDRTSQLVTEEIDAFRFVCAAPCNETVLVRPDAAVVLGNDPPLLSAPVHLDPALHDVTLRVRPSSLTLRRTGQVLLGIGGAGAIVGVLTLPPGIVANSSDLKAASGVALATGAASLAIGTVLYLRSRTAVDVVPGVVAF